MRAISFSRTIKILVLLIMVVPVVFINQTRAAEVTSRRIALGTSTVSAVTTYDISFDIISVTDVGSIVLEICDNTPLETVPCTPSPGFDWNLATFSGQTGETGFSVHGNTTASRIVLGRAPAAPTPGPVSYSFTNVPNPSTLGTHYLRISTHITDDGTGAFTDRGGAAFSLNSGVDVSTFVPPFLEFCVGVAITSSDCSVVTGSNINFGNFSDASTAFATTQMVGATNGVGGYTVSVDGTTMTSGNNTIAALSGTGPSNTGVSQFGLNLRNNSSPNVGQNVTGLGSGAVRPNYNSVDNFRFNDGEQVAFSPLSTDYNKYTVSYIVNINTNQAPGVYATTISYIALATF